jgi:hypothetical protein
MRIGFYLLAGVLFGALSALVSPAADARPHHHQRLHAAHFVRPNAAALPAVHNDPTGIAKPQDHGASDADGAFAKGGRNAEHPSQPATTKAGGEGTPDGVRDASSGTPAKDATSPDVHVKDLGPVDTRISVEPPLRGVKTGRIRSAKTKFKAVSRRGLQVHPKLAPTTAVRNSIGVRIRPQGADKGGGAGGTPKPPAGNGGPGVAGFGLRPKAFNSAPAGRGGLPATTMNHPNIGGGTMLRPTTASGVIGGPAKNVVGALNGTTFRRRHP